MDTAGLVAELGTRLRDVIRGTVACVNADGRAEVVPEEHGDRPLMCDLLETSGGRGLSLEPGDVVLVWESSDSEGFGVILGRIVRADSPLAHELEQATPDELVIEAKSNLTLKCGEGSITIREDGKILIKGKELVSHAKRMNRIKGGSVAIN